MKQEEQDATTAWRQLIIKPFIVRGRIGHVSNKIVAAYATFGDAVSIALNVPESTITDSLRRKVVWKK